MVIDLIEKWESMANEDQKKWFKERNLPERKYCYSRCGIGISTYMVVEAIIEGMNSGRLQFFIAPNEAIKRQIDRTRALLGAQYGVSEQNSNWLLKIGVLEDYMKRGFLSRTHDIYICDWWVMSAYELFKVEECLIKNSSLIERKTWFTRIPEGNPCLTLLGHSSMVGVGESR